MEFINEIIDNHIKKEDGINTKENMVVYPTKEEIRIMDVLLEKYTTTNPDDMVPFDLWNGDCMHTVFEEMSDYAKEIGENPWDVFALFIKKIQGLVIEKDGEGGVTVKHRKE